MPAFWYYLFLGAIIQGFVLFIVLLAKGRERQANTFLGLLLALMSVQLIQYVIIWKEEVRQYPYFMGMYMYVQFFYGPLLYFYLRSLEHDTRKLNRLHLAPMAFILGLFVFSHIRSPQGVVAFFAQFAKTIFPAILVGAGIISLFFYALLLLRHYQKKKSTLPQPQVRWYRNVLSLYAAYSISYASYYLVSRYPFFNEYWDYLIALIMSIGLYGIGFMGYFKPQLISDKNMRKKFAAKYATNGITASVSSSVLKKMEDLMQTEGLHRENIRLDDLSRRLNISRHQLSRIINEKTCMSFNEYINQYRVREALGLLERHPDMSIKEICYQVGFNNRTSFHKHFKKLTGKTPTEYRSS